MAVTADEKLIPEEILALRARSDALIKELTIKAQEDEKLRNMIASMDTHCGQALQAIETMFKAMVWMSYCSGAQLSALYGEKANSEEFHVH